MISLRRKVPVAEDTSNCPNLPELSQNFLSLMGSAWMSQAIYVAAELGLADLIKCRPMHAGELALQCGCDSSAMNRLLRGLCSIGICSQTTSGAFELGDMGEFLLSESSHSLRDMVLWWGKSHWELWGYLLFSGRTGRSAR